MEDQGSSLKMTEAPNRASIQSGFSEFSFEHNDDALVSATPKLADRLGSPTKFPGIDTLLKENSELKSKVSEQAQTINHLKNEIYELQQELKKKEKPKLVPADIIIEPKSTQGERINFSELSPPPRSANRAKPSPIKSLSSECSNITMTQPNETNEALSTGASNEHLSSDLDVELLKTPSEVSRESSSYSAVTDPASPKKNLLAPINQSPYKGRIQNSPLESVSNASSILRSPSASETPQTQASPFTTRSISDHSVIKGIGSKSQENLSTKSRQISQNNSFANDIGSITAPPPFASSFQNSMPSSPLDNKFNQGTPKSNLYDAYEGDFQHQQIHQYHNGYGGVYNDPASPAPGGAPPAQEAKHQRFPSDVLLFVNPGDLNTVKTEIISTITGNFTKKSDDPFVVITACDRKTGVEMWRFKKTLSQVVMLDTQIRPLINSFSLPPIPEKSLFLSNVPVKVDIRRLRLRDYFSTLFTIPHLPLDAAYQISRFMSQDVVNLVDESNTEVMKDGYLLRRSKGLSNNWKSRYCQVDGPFLNVFDAKEGPLLEIIKLTGSQIGRQPDNVKPTDDKTSYRHAFAVMEPKKSPKSTSYTKHIFCAETDQERDLWVNVLVQFVEDPSAAASTFSGDSSSISSQTVINQESSLPSPSSVSSTSNRSLAPPVNKGDDYDELEELAKEAKRNKKRSFFPFSKKAFNEELEFFKAQHGLQDSQDDTHTLQEDSSLQNGESNIEKSLQSMNLSTDHVTERVFHSEVSDSIKLSSHELYGQEVPSIIYRCLSYLLSTGAVIQEGLFRLNGSASLIRQLREGLDKSYDINFDEMDPKPDINSIAGLLKLYFRELPTTILTKEHYPEFRDAYNQRQDPSDLSLKFREIVKTLPSVNYSVIYVLFRFLNEVIENQDANKMNLRNLCIVFSPTLNIASEVIIPFLVDFKCIFEDADPIDNKERETVDVHIPTF